MPEKKIGGIKACVFDYYGTQFYVHSAAAQYREDSGDKADQVRRKKQLQYSWLRNLIQESVPFWQVTGKALNCALAKSGLNDPALCKS